MDFMSILAGLAATSLVALMIAAGSILALVEFVSWGAKKVGRFFDDQKEKNSRDVFETDLLVHRAHMDDGLYSQREIRRIASGDNPRYDDAQVLAARDYLSDKADARDAKRLKVSVEEAREYREYEERNSKFN